MDYISPLINRTNVIFGAIGALLSMILGDHWILFISFLVLNVADYVTGWIKASLKGKINSAKGANGALKKLGYWIMIMVGFSMSVIFMEVGKAIGADLGFTLYIGYFVLITLIINEIRSILENLVEAGYNVPKALTKGLEAADKVVDKVMNGGDEEEEENDQDLPPEDS